MSIYQGEGWDSGLIHHLTLFRSIELWLVNESPKAKKQSKPHMLPSGPVIV